MGLPIGLRIVPALGITGGINIGVTYFGTETGSSEPPGICAYARPTLNLHGTSNPAPVAAPSFSSRRLLSIALSLHVLVDKSMVVRDPSLPMAISFLMFVILPQACATCGSVY